MTRIALSTASTYPESTARGFEWAARVGYDGVEVMVGLDSLSQQISAVRQLSEHHGLPVVSVHAPCLLFTQRVWGTEPWGKLERSADMAHVLGAQVVVVHPPFRWQREYAAGFVEGIAELEERTGLHFAVENMYPWRAGTGERWASASSRLPRGVEGLVENVREGLTRGREIYQPSWDPSRETYAHTTIDLSHAAIAGDDVVAMAERMGGRLRHVHLTDGTGSAKDEHLVPGRGTMRAAEFLTHLGDTGFAGDIVVEINTRRAADPAERERDLRDSLEFARTHFTRP